MPWGITPWQKAYVEIYILNTKQIDLSMANALNNILINHYRLSKGQLADIENHIANEGILFISGFGR